MISAVFLKSIAAFSTAATIGLGPPVTTVMPGESQVLINWVAPILPFNGVDVEQSADSGNTWTTYLKLPPTSTHVRVQGLVDGKNYYFRVRWIWPDKTPLTVSLGLAPAMPWLQKYMVHSTNTPALGPFLTGLRNSP